jgi:hypothetical protein
MSPVSVIITKYDHARFLPKWIESVLRRTFPDFELTCWTVVPLTKADRFSPSVRGSSNENRTQRSEFRKPVKQWNKGVGLARGEYVWIAESDTMRMAVLLRPSRVHLWLLSLGPVAPTNRLE